MLLSYQAVDFSLKVNLKGQESNVRSQRFEIITVIFKYR